MVVKIKVWGFIFLFICAFATLSYVKERMIELAGKRRLKSRLQTAIALVLPLQWYAAMKL